MDDNDFLTFVTIFFHNHVSVDDLIVVYNFLEVIIHL